MKLVREYINEKFTDKSDPIHDMGIGDKGVLIKNRLEELAKKHGYSSYKNPSFIDIDIVESWGFKGVKFIECWYKEGEENFREVVLFSYKSHYDDTQKGIKYGIYESDEEGESGGDKIDWPNDHVFSDKYWGIEVY